MSGYTPDPLSGPARAVPLTPPPGAPRPAAERPPVHGPVPVQPLWAARPRGGTGTGATVLLIISSSLALLLVAWFLWWQLGTTAFLLCGILALVPLGICLLGLHWVDRWEPEPRSALVFAFLWGAGISVGAALLVGPYVARILDVLFPELAPEFIGLVLEAPIVEETAKGLGVLLLVFVRRGHFDGPVDGIVYAGTVAAGFAFTENILYFGSALLSSGGLGAQLGFVFVLRGLFSPFAHVLFTAAIGVGLGVTVRRGGALRITAGFLGGLIAAILGHMFWNGGIALVSGSFFMFYFLLQVPMFALAVTGVVLLRRAEQRLTRHRLGEYAAAGWFTPQEVLMLSTRAGRHQALSWAGRFGARGTMKTFIREATRLALTRQQIAAGRNLPANRTAELTLLQDLTRTRGLMLAQAGGA